MTEHDHAIVIPDCFRCDLSRAEVQGEAREPLTADDERALAADADRERGYFLPRAQRSRRARELADGAPTHEQPGTP